MTKIKVVIKYPGEDAREAMIENELEALQKIVRGYIEVVPFAGDLLLIVNEEGKLQNMAPNIIMLQSIDDDVRYYEIIRGPVIVTRASGEEFLSLSNKQVKKALVALERMTFPPEPLRRKEELS